MLTVGFHQPHLCLRGTTVAMYDYAYYNQTILGNKSVVFYCEDLPDDYPKNDPTVIEKFRNSGIELCAVNTAETHPGADELNAAIEKLGVDVLYITKAGHKDERIATACKTVIQAIGCVPYSEAHGDVYSYGSQWLSDHCSQGKAPVVPYMVWLPETEEDLRSELGIPPDATVFGRTGGRDTWNLRFATPVIQEVLRLRSDIYFLFQNTPISFEHPRMIHVKNSGDLNYKTKFINSCDAMIHSRIEGESFGLACAEFSIRNKPVITWSKSAEKNHIVTLGDKGIYYDDAPQMLYALLNFVRNDQEDYNCYRDFTPEKVMQIFKKVYLD